MPGGWELSREWFCPDTAQETQIQTDTDDQCGCLQGYRELKSGQLETKLAQKSVWATDKPLRPDREQGKIGADREPGKHGARRTVSRAKRKPG